MSDTATPITPVTTTTTISTSLSDSDHAKIASAVQDGVDSIKDIVTAISAYKANGMSGLTAQTPAFVALAQKDYEDVKSVIPVVSAGVKTSEFWMAVGSVLLIAVPAAIGHPLPFDSTALIAVISGIYSMVRGQVKASTAIAAATTATANAKMAQPPPMK